MLISLCLVNRAFIIGTFVGFIFLLLVYDKIKISKKNSTIITLSLMILIASLVFFIKSDSSLGRMLIYKISWPMFTDNFFTGMGFGKFQINYNLYQSAYFRSGNFTEKEFLLADSVFFAFNDYWQFIIEFGLIGLITMVGILALIFKVIKRAFRIDSTSHFNKLIASLLIIVLIAALFTHVFEKRFFQLFTIISITWFVFVYSNQKIQLVYRRLLFIVFILGFLAFEYANDIFNVNANHKFEKAKILSSAGYRLESQKLYDEIYPKLKNDIGFLINYCDEFFDYKDSKTLLKDYLHLATKRTEYRIYLRMALIYEKLNQDQKAEEMYLKAVYMVPNRFTSRFELFKFYLDRNNFVKAREWGTSILKMPIKIPSQRILIIKKEIRKKVNEISSFN